MERVTSENKTTQGMFQEYDLLPSFLNFQFSFGEAQVFGIAGIKRESLSMTRKLIENFICTSCCGLGKREEGESSADNRSAKLWAWKKSLCDTLGTCTGASNEEEVLHQQAFGPYGERKTFSPRNTAAASLWVSCFRP